MSEKKTFRFDRLVDLAGVLVQRRPGRRGFQPARGTLEQRAADLVLQQPQALGQGRLGYLLRLRRRVHVQRLIHGEEVLEVP